jgi:phage tail sheath protein FI
MHIIVIDAGGMFTGTQGTVLETFAFVSKASDAAVNGATNYYKQVIFNKSKYIYAIDPVDYVNQVGTWGTPAAGTTFNSPSTNKTTTLAGGSDAVPTQGQLETAYGLFANKEQVDISLILTGDASVEVQQYVIDNVVNSRRDAVAFISPPQSAVVNQAGQETGNIQTWLSNLSRNSSYVVADSGWKYQLDKYNNVYRWIPLNGDIAGLCVYTDTVRDPWYSPAGYNRGAIKNAIKLAWNPSKTYRDVIYAAGVNPVVSFPGQGIVLWGDKTLQSKPSAFDRINVRRLFIALEKSISTAAKYSLFELNDEFTRAQFVALINPFLRDVQGRRGITDYKVICDGTNNTPQVIDTNQFVGDIYIKPTRSINYIQLNFVAVGTGVDFTTIVGAA